MSPAEKKALSADDRILWGRVARSVRPLPGKMAAALEVEEIAFAELLDPPSPLPRETAAAVLPEAPMHPAAAPTPASGRRRIDAPTRDKLAKGRLPIEGKVDLHGLTQSEAHSLLLAFLHRAYSEGRRHVLVVTGKGSSLGSDGILRRAVPSWLATPPFRALVGGHESAARRHGGSGAIYVRLRKQGGGPA